MKLDELTAADQEALGRFLLAIARQRITTDLGQPAPPPPPPPATASPLLDQPAATFVTLTQHGRLRGCIGRLEASRPLLADVEGNAHAAAFSDPRFPPLGAAELASTRIEVSLLTAPTPLPVTDEADACRKLRPGIDGVIIDAGWRCATFLPQVWDSLPDPMHFLAELKRKAGLPAEGWAPDYRLSCYQVHKWAETAA
jgi:AmmeMemoRadiSam system protein A